MWPGSTARQSAFYDLLPQHGLASRLFPVTSLLEKETSSNYAPPPGGLVTHSALSQIEKKTKGALACRKDILSAGDFVVTKTNSR